MSNLISLEEFKTYNPNYDNTQDVLVEQLITTVSADINRICDRDFVKSLHYEWTGYHNADYPYQPREYPVNYVLGVFAKHNALSVTNSGLTTVTITATPTSVIVSDDTLTSTEFTFAANTTLTVLDLAISASFADLVIASVAAASQVSRTLYPATYTVSPSGTVDVVGVEYANSEVSVSGDTVYPVGANQLVVYNAGYDPIPDELKMLTARVVNDYLGIQTGSQNIGITSESITNHSVSYGEAIATGNILANYAADLSKWQRVYIGG